MDPRNFWKLDVDLH
jgi:hypothetical protein